MKREILLAGVLLIAVFGVFCLSGCSCLLGGQAGAMLNSYTVTDSVPGWQLRKIKPGTRVVFSLRDGTKVDGEYEGLVGVPEKEYAEIYYKSQEQMPEGIVLLTLGDIMTYTLLSSEEKYDVRFLGFDYGYININPIETDKPEKLWLENIKNITDNYGNKIGGEMLRKLMHEGKIPVSSVISVKKGGENISLAIDEVDQIKIKNKKEINTAGFIVGAVIDLAVGGYIFYYFITSFPHW